VSIRSKIAVTVASYVRLVDASGTVCQGNALSERKATAARHSGGLTRLLTSALLCLATAACSNAVASPGAPASGTGSERALTAREKTLLYDAEQILVQECMRRQGFTVWKVPQNPVPEAKDFPYGVDDVAWAKVHGYGSDIQRRIERVRATDPNRLYVQGLKPERSAAAIAALNGPSPVGLKAAMPGGGALTRSTQGCTSTSEAALYGDLPDWFRVNSVTNALPGVRRNQVFADPAFTRAVRKWSACMRKGGYDYSGLDAAHAKFADVKTPKARSAEIRTAVAEAECSRSSGLSATANRLDQHYEAQLQKKYGATIRTRLRMENAALPKAASIVSK
jgi:hypothetical protein